MSKREIDALLDQMLHQMDRISTQWEQSESSTQSDNSVNGYQGQPAKETGTAEYF